MVGTKVERVFRDIPWNLVLYIDELLDSTNTSILIAIEVTKGKRIERG